MKNILQSFNISCFKSTQLIEKRHIYNLSFMEKMQLKIHTKTCKTCASYKYKSDLIEKGISDNVNRSEPSSDTSNLIHKILKNIDDGA